VKRQKGAITWKGLGEWSDFSLRKTPMVCWFLTVYVWLLWLIHKWQIWGVARNAGHLRLLEQHFEFHNPATDKGDCLSHKKMLFYVFLCYVFVDLHPPIFIKLKKRHPGDVTSGEMTPRTWVRET
jgi:hypothetical protein